ncbi:ATP-binding cassette sub-family C member 9-like [Glandiceps talaboti]
MAQSISTQWLCIGNKSSDVPDEQCLVDFIAACTHTLFLTFFCVTIAVLGCCTDLRHFTPQIVRLFPGHNCKWILSALLCLTLLCAVGEGILTDLTRNDVTQPRMYGPQVVALVTGLVTLVYYHHMEYWNRPGLAWLLLSYWVISLVGEGVKMKYLLSQLEFDIRILRFDVIMASASLYTCCLVVEINLLRTKLFRLCYHENESPRDTTKKYMYFKHGHTNLLSRMTFWWMKRLFVLGYKKPLEISDIGCLSEDFDSKYQYQLFDNAYKVEKERAAKHSVRPSLWRTYIKAYGIEMAIATFVKLLGDTCAFIPPIAIGGIVAYGTAVYYGEDKTVGSLSYYVTVGEFFGNGFVLIGVMALGVLGRLLFTNYGQVGAVVKGIHLRTALQAYIYEKSLHLSSWTLSSGEMTIGKITNHMAVDAMALQVFCEYFQFGATIPYQIIVTLVLLYLELGVSALAGYGFVVLSIPMQYMITRYMAKVQQYVLTYSDERLKKSHELLQGIKLLKLYGWEERFCSAIEDVRRKEVNALLNIGVQTIMLNCRIISNVTESCSLSPLCELQSFAVYSAISPTPLTPEQTFATLALVIQLSLPMGTIPMVLRTLVNAIICTKRLHKFFNTPEIEYLQNGRLPVKRGYTDVDEYCEDIDNNLLKDSQHDNSDTTGDGTISKQYITMQNNDESSSDSRLRNGRPEYGTFESETHLTHNGCTSDVPEHIALQITDGIFSWESDGVVPVLKNINLCLPTGSLSMIIGIVGSGKSSLLSAILGEMVTLSGSVEFNRNKNRVSYVPQKAWMQNATLRDNILFGQRFKYDRYQSVIEACALQPDLDILPAGDMTEIGERGINLSGGQKQRVSIARAIYSNTDIVLMDDPFSALDVHIGSHVMEYGIMDLLLRADRTVIVVSHRVQNLDYANLVILMENGEVSRQDNLRELKTSNPELFAEWTRLIESVSESDTGGAQEDAVQDGDIDQETLRFNVPRVQDEKGTDENLDSTGALISNEEREKGSVSWKIYLAYAKAVKLPLVVLVLTLFAAVGAMQMATDFWLAEWSEAGVRPQNETGVDPSSEVVYYLSVYAVLLLGYIIVTIVATSCNIIFSLLAAKRIHIALLRNIVHAPLRFFETNPLGRILNRFSSDTNIIDQRIWMTILYVCTRFIMFVCAVVVNIVVVPIFALLIIPLLLPYYLIPKFFIKSSRELQRLDSITRSPVFAQFSESLGGLQTIRAYRDEARFKKYLTGRIDTNNTPHVYVQFSYRWLTVQMELVGTVFILASGLSTLITCVLGNLEPSLVGLSLSYSFSLVGRLNWLVRMVAEMEMQMNAVERVEYYTRINSEEYRGIVNPPHDWPDKGSIDVKNISVRYSVDLPPVLHDVNVNFEAGQKIGICGRTGSGKSSLTLALFRLVDTFQGSIIIDGIDISHVPLLTLRNRLAIIPQDPVLFAGTIRYNLDPEMECNDNDLWEALEIAQLTDNVRELDKQLDSDVSQDGENFSVGQRQLFCLARAFLRKARILVMDEATASIDIKTDAILQKVVSTAFADRTVLTIAHRISTIVDSDTVLVLSDGRVVEYGSPKILYRNNDSMFASLVKRK